MKRTCYSIAHTAWLDCLIDDDGDDALNAIDEISVKNKLYRTQKLFRTPNVDEYTTILSEVSLFLYSATVDFGNVSLLNLCTGHIYLYINFIFSLSLSIAG